jgi:hypothetical protein
MAVVGCVLMVIGAVCPLVLFRLLAFVDPGTPSGAAMRQSFDSAGGFAGLLNGDAAAGDGTGPGSGASLKQAGAGQSQGEASAATATASRFGAAFAPAGSVFAKGIEFAGSVAGKATAISADVLASSGIGHQAPYYQDAGPSQPGGRGSGGNSDTAGGDSGGSGGTAGGDSGAGEDPTGGGGPAGGGRPVPSPSPSQSMPGGAVGAVGAAAEAAPLVIP